MDYLPRVIDALKAQTLPREQWELLLVDNASKEPLALTCDLSWHPNARHIREEELGLTPARLRGIQESRAELLIFVDDDNVLAADYLENALEVIKSRQWMGAFGGRIKGEFEREPEKEIHGMFGCLALLEVEKEIWGFLPGAKAFVCVPFGAGMIIRKAVAKHYAERAAQDSLRRNLDRKGASLSSSGDIDMALCAYPLNFAVGRFPQLQLTHLIPSARLERDYLLRLREGMTFSNTILEFIWDRTVPQLVEDNPSRSQRLFRSYQNLRNRLKGGRKITFEEELNLASHRGLLKALQILQSLPHDS